jgi:hypothetical protein
MQRLITEKIVDSILGSLADPARALGGHPRARRHETQPDAERVAGPSRRRRERCR